MGFSVFLKFLKETDELIYMKKLENGLGIIESVAYIMLFLYAFKDKTVKIIEFDFFLI